MTEFKKEVSAVEKYFAAYNEIRPPFVIQLVLEGDGDPSAEALHAALERTTDANPGSSMALQDRNDPKHWQIGPPPTLTVLDEPEFDARMSETGPFLFWHLDSYTGPTCELVMVRGKSKTYLVFRALHAVMDGQGTILWAKDFMRCLRGEEPVGHPSTVTIEQLVKAQGDERREYREADALHPFGPANQHTSGGYFWRRVTVDRALDGGATGRICVALAERARAGGKEGVVRINLPTDLRHFQPKERTTGNLFSSLFVEVPPGASPDMLSFKVVQMLYTKEGIKRVGTSKQESSSSLAFYRVNALWDLANQHETGLYTFSASISHLGLLKRDDLSGPDFSASSAFFVPLVGDSGCVIHINGFEKKVECTVGLSDHFADGGRLDELAALVTRAIEGGQE